MCVYVCVYLSARLQEYHVQDAFRQVRQQQQLKRIPRFTLYYAVELLRSGHRLLEEHLHSQFMNTYMQLQ